MSPWIWFVLALFLATLEILTPGGFWMLFLGFGAFVVGILAGTGLLEPAWMQWAVFSVVSVLGLVLLRKPMRRLLDRSTPSSPIDSMVGESCQIVEAIPADGFGSAELRGSLWKARSESGQALGAGQRAQVASIEGLTLVLKA